MLLITALQKNQIRTQSLAVTLDSVAASITQTLTHGQSLAITLDEIIVSVSQVSNHNQSLAITLDGVTVAISQTATHSQSLASTLDGVVVDIVQSLASSGNSQALAVTLDGVVVAISSVVQHSQVLAATLDGVIVDVVQNNSNVLIPIQALITGGGFVQNKRHELDYSIPADVINQNVNRLVTARTLKDLPEIQEQTVSDIVPDARLQGALLLINTDSIATEFQVNQVLIQAELSGAEFANEQLRQTEQLRQADIVQAELMQRIKNRKMLLLILAELA